MRPVRALRVVALALVLCPALLGAQLLVGGNRATNGSRRFGPGDRVEVPLWAGGRSSLRNLALGDHCLGQVTRQPDFVARIPPGGGTLHLTLDARDPVALVVNTARGEWVCSESAPDAGAGLALERVAPGRYDVWASALQPGRLVEATLRITLTP